MLWYGFPSYMTIASLINTPSPAMFFSKYHDTHVVLRKPHPLGGERNTAKVLRNVVGIQSPVSRPAQR